MPQSEHRSTCLGRAGARLVPSSKAMPRVFHIVATNRFAGVERYVSDTAAETARRGWGVAVVGGDATRMTEALGASVRWAPGSTSSRRFGRYFDLGAGTSATLT